MVCVGLASRKGHVHARRERILAVLVDQYELALQHEDEFVLLLVPVTERGGGSRLKGKMVDAELGYAKDASEPLFVPTLKPLRVANRRESARRRRSDPSDV